LLQPPPYLASAPFLNLQECNQKLELSLTESATSRFARVQGTAFRPLQKIIRPAPPALGHSGNRKQPVDFMAIPGVDAKYISNGEIMIGSLDHPDLISGPHIALDDDS
jgi:hypothetical protein